ncbi:prolyl-tRNA synthetase [Atractiella rhizophila]|nr:prolyl-tRNA synthetase [Atractiella rhizophila]
MSAAPNLLTHFFKPKSAAKDSQISLVVVSLEQGKELGKASELAKKLGFKDMRALPADGVKELLGGKGKEEASPFTLPSSITPTTARIVLSNSLPSSISIPSRQSANQVETVGTDALVKHILELGWKEEEIERLDFNAAGAAPAAAPAPVQARTTVVPATSAAPTSSEPPSGMGISIKKDGGDFGGWYQQVLTRGDMIDYYDISGCYIFKPWSYGIWQDIQHWFDKEIKRLGVQNAYFPMFVSSKVLEKEKDHIEGFAPEVAWVTKAGSSDLEEPIAIRPTSETVMYPYYAKWIRSHRDLPLKLNQWNNVVRWEFKNPQPFLRTREFLWQEGHTAHLTKPEADTMVTDILDRYQQIYQELLAVPVIKGIKSEKEKFAGGLYTTTVEGFIPSAGRGIQGGTSHCLGQNFSKMFNISVEDPDNPADAATGKEAGKIDVWQTSWGFTTRSIGVMVMIHGDDKGLVIPPRVAQLQVIVVPTGVTKDTSDEKRKEILGAAENIVSLLEAKEIRVQADLREGYTPGHKYNHWEMRGVPLRVDIGPKDIEKSQVIAVRRDTGEKIPIKMEGFEKSIQTLLETIQNDLFKKAKADFDTRLKVITEWSNFVPTLNGRNICVIPWCEVEECEDKIKERSAAESAAVQDERAPSAGAKSLCIPFDQAQFPAIEAGNTKCPNCGRDSKKWTLFGRSY